MKLLHLFSIPVTVCLILLLIRSDVKANDTSCLELVHPLATKVERVKAQGGIWGIFDKHYKVRNHAVVTLKLDSTITFLMVAVDHLCSTQNGIPYDEIATVIIPWLKEKGEKVFMEDMINIGHTKGEAENLVKFAKYSEMSRTRKLDLNQIKKTIDSSIPLIGRLIVIADTIGKKGSEEILAESKILIEDVGKLRATDPYLIQAIFEDEQIPNARYITNNSDAM